MSAAPAARPGTPRTGPARDPRPARGTRRRAPRAPRAPRRPGATGRLRASLRHAAPALAGYLLVRLAGLLVLANWANGEGRDLWPLLATEWDSKWYLDIADRGYDRTVTVGDRHSNLAFFPLYPAAVRAVDWLVPGSPATAGLWVSIAASLAAAGGIFAIGDLLYGRRAGCVLAMLWGATPVALVQWMGYTESLFTALAAWSLHAVLAGHWVRAGALAALAGLTRPTGVAAAAAVSAAAAVALWRLWRQREGPRGRGRPVRADDRGSEGAGGARTDVRGAGCLLADGTGAGSVHADGTGAVSARADGRAAVRTADTPGAGSAVADSAGVRPLPAGSRGAVRTDSPDAGPARADSGGSVRADSASTESVRADSPGRPAADSPAASHPRTADSPGRDDHPRGGAAGPSTAHASPAWRRVLAGAVLAPLGWLGFVGWVGFRLGSWDGYFAVQKDWRNEWDGGADTLEALGHNLTELSRPQLFMVVVSVVLLVSAGLYLLCLADRQPLALLVFSGVLLLIVLGSGGVYFARARFLMPAFPLLLPVAVAVSRARRPAAVLVLVSAALTSAYLGGYLSLVFPGPP